MLAVTDISTILIPAIFFGRTTGTRSGSRTS
jgi:hypothetical protein